MSMLGSFLLLMLSSWTQTLITSYSVPTVPLHTGAVRICQHSHAFNVDNCRHQQPNLSMSKGAGSHRSGRFPSVGVEYRDDIYRRHLSEFDHSGVRWLLAARKNRYQEGLDLQLQIAANATLVAPGLWETRSPIARALLPRLASVRVEILPLVRSPCASMNDFAKSIKALNLNADDWTLHHERVEKIPEIPNSNLWTRSSTNPSGGSLQGSALRCAVADSLLGIPNHRSPKVRYVIIESMAGLMFGVATWSEKESAVEESVEIWNTRPIHFSSALDPIIASLAVSYANLSREEVLLDPCCGSGTILFAALEHGARACGLDHSPRMAAIARTNLAHAGYPSLAGGGLRRWAAGDDDTWDESVRCMVAVHDLWEPLPPAGLGRVSEAACVVTNLPHGKNLKLPYPGYIRDMLFGLAAAFPGRRGCGPAGGVASKSYDGGGGGEIDGGRGGRRFVFVAGGELLQEGGGNGVRGALEAAGFQVRECVAVLGGTLTLTCAV